MNDTKILCALVAVIAICELFNSCDENATKRMQACVAAHMHWDSVNGTCGEPQRCASTER